MSQTRGSITLFKDIFNEQDEKPVEKQRKGRSKELDSKRNECLLDRYFFYGKFSGLRYDLILNLLSEEFFLSPVTIPKVIDENLEKLAQIKKEKPSKEHFQKKWPHLNWSQKFFIS